MARKSSSHYEFSIPGDELEHHRIQLENNLQNTDLSLHLSSVPDTDDGDNESVEYPRHNSASEHLGLVSFEQLSRENIDFDGHSHLHAWSLHDDEGINPYDAQTISTVAHHASAVTITAGLARGGRREPSISGAEYDPERPLQDIMAGMGSKLSMGDMYSHSKYRNTQAMSTRDDFSVHDSIQADAVSMAARLRSPKATDGGSDPEETDRSQDISRPKLSETLERVGFSPRRPRGTQSRVSQPLEASHRYADASFSRRSITPKARKASVVSFDVTTTPSRRHVSQPSIIQPQLNIQPPTPSASSSRFTKMARGLARDVRQAQDQWHSEDAVDAVPASTSVHRPVVKDASNRTVADTTGELHHISRASRRSSRGRVHLPDVTGLTNAVVSPAKANLERYGLRGPGSREVEARLVASLNTLHARLTHLETENGVARRRVRELEYELEQCKRDVVRERTRIMESQDAIDITTARTAGPSTSRAKGKEKKSKEPDQHASRYFEIVEERKALEALITTLRIHLTRVTSDLSSQQQLLEDLRGLRESDALSLAEKTQEINQLRTEVERLAGEIEVLRGVVEEGLNERRQVREGVLDETTDHPVASAATDPELSLDAVMPEKSNMNYLHRPPTPALSLRRSPPGTPTHSNHSRVPSPSIVDSPAPSIRRFINREELDRISADLDERRSERASNASSQAASLSEENSDAEGHVSVVQSAQHECDEARPASPAPSSVKSRQTTRAHVRIQDPKLKGDAVTSNPPFPSINSERMERLFFSAPRHNANSCRMCKGRRSTSHDAVHRESNNHRAPHERDGNDEGFDEGVDPGADGVRGVTDGIAVIPTVSEILERMDRNGGTLKPVDIPPQTVLARVVGELEDEFTHFREIYSDLAEEYKSLDCATQTAKRRVVADHLRDVIDILERKGNQIASLYELLIFKDKPLEG
ncbi:hypothetical protein BDN67DRAFT_905345 [Paxillus ammoniavirescens]|nr:hypothetical protein BDN67DRAFT_905345 [Paxillus ammoniavirescens]